MYEPAEVEKLTRRIDNPQAELINSFAR